MFITQDNQQSLSMTAYKRLLLITTCLTFCVVILGAYVRLSDAGLGCPDWPGCYGHLSVPQSKAEIAVAQLSHPGSTLEPHKAWKEMIHRYVAGTLGLFILNIAVIAWLRRKSLGSPTIPLLTLGVVLLQAMLGMWTVTLLLKPVIVTAHLLGGMTILALLTWLTMRAYHPYFAVFPIKSKSLRGWAALAVFLLFLQILLGGWVSANYAALACPDFPLCQSEWIPPMQFSDSFHIFRELGKNSEGGFLTLANLTAIHWLHRVGALIIFVYLTTFSLKLARFKEARPHALLILTLLTLQLGLGITNVLLQLPLPVAVAHNAGAALLLVIIITANFRLFNERAHHDPKLK